ncbi:hypothetical protein [Mycoplasmopsis verecunda]|uniref:Uncharacterized protein n=1 Tax=Mycoplasmopsis verecunda TaxID=171291 RepID=A0A1T4L3V1_9BACT|nr:hypothetical protein [Mycoplasmopsis verecunda]WPB54440.1 hypothetical protein SAM46_03060 [Mycoplasmopsis verecunda]SJZ49374.1 hypothetical protein SAMN02745154_00316 [Mycoplasmopsis verecunda]
MKAINTMINIASCLSAAQPSIPIDNVPSFQIREIDWNKVRPIHAITDLDRIKSTTIIEDLKNTGRWDYIEAYDWCNQHLLQYENKHKIIEEFISKYNLWFTNDKRKHDFIYYSIYIFLENPKSEYSKNSFWISELLDEKLTYIYINRFINLEWNKWINAHLISPYILQVYDLWITDYITSNLVKMKETYKVVKKYYKDKKNLMYIDEYDKNNVYLANVAKWHCEQNKIQIQEAKEDFVYDVKNKIQNYIKSYTDIRDFLTDFDNKLYSIEAGKITTNVISWLCSIGWIIADVASYGALSVQMSMSIADSINGTTTLVEIKNIRNELQDNIKILKDFSSELHDIKELLNIRNVHDFYSKVASYPNIKDIVNLYPIDVLEKIELSADVVDFFTHIKEKIVNKLASISLKLAKKLAIGNGRETQSIIAAENKLGKGVLAGKELFSIKNLLAKNIKNTFMNSVLEISKILNITKRMSMVTNIANLGSGIISLVDIPLDIVFNRLMERYNNEIMEY